MSSPMRPQPLHFGSPLGAGPPPGKTQLQREGETSSNHTPRPSSFSVDVSVSRPHSNSNGGTEQEVDALHCRISNQTDKKQSLTQSLSAPCVASFSPSRKSEGTTPRKKIVFDDDDDNPEQEATRVLSAMRGLEQVKAETGDENAENAHRHSK